MSMDRLLRRLEESYKSPFIDHDLIDIKNHWGREWPQSLIGALKNAAEDELRDRLLAVDQWVDRWIDDIARNGGEVDNDLLYRLTGYVEAIRDDIMVPAHKKAGLMSIEDGRITDQVLTDSLMRIAVRDLGVRKEIIGRATPRWLRPLEDTSPWKKG